LTLRPLIFVFTPCLLPLAFSTSHAQSTSRPVQEVQPLYRGSQVVSPAPSDVRNHAAPEIKDEDAALEIDPGWNVDSAPDAKPAATPPPTLNSQGTTLPPATLAKPTSSGPAKGDRYRHLSAVFGMQTIDAKAFNLELAQRSLPQIEETRGSFGLTYQQQFSGKYIFDVVALRTLHNDTFGGTFQNRAMHSQLQVNGGWLMLRKYSSEVFLLAGIVTMNSQIQIREDFNGDLEEMLNEPRRGIQLGHRSFGADIGALWQLSLSRFVPWPELTLGLRLGLNLNIFNAAWRLDGSGRIRGESHIESDGLYALLSLGYSRGSITAM
jgi:hypothetical protein